MGGIMDKYDRLLTVFIKERNRLILERDRCVELIRQYEEAIALVIDIQKS